MFYTLFLRCSEQPKDHNSDFSKKAETSECENTDVGKTCDLRCKPGYHEIPIKFNCTIETDAKKNINTVWKPLGKDSKVTSFCKKSEQRIQGTNIYCLTVLWNEKNHTAYCGNYDEKEKLPKFS